MKNIKDFNPIDYPNELVELIEKMLFQSIEHLESFRKLTLEEQREIAKEYIQEYLYNQQF